MVVLSHSSRPRLMFLRRVLCVCACVSLSQLQRCYKSVTRVLQGCYRGVTRARPLNAERCSSYWNGKRWCKNKGNLLVLTASDLAWM
jgi:hypothetical protein